MCEEGIMFGAHGAKLKLHFLFGLVLGDCFFQIVTQNSFLFRLKRHLFQTSCFEAEIKLDAVMLL